ncbi:MAG: hypothetical protein OXC11_12695 [Rhodospirillales bacterium]|nr:hypothetical protein [Rhodospirillales bacterium]
MTNLEPWNVLFDPVDPSRLARDLDPRRRGRDAGERGRPPLDALSDPNEREITGWFEQRIREAAALYERRREEALQGLRETEATGGFTPTDLHETRIRAEQSMNDLRQTRRSPLHAARIERDKRLDDLADFKERNRLRREPSYPKQWTRHLMTASVFALGLLETFLNSNFLAEGSETGLLGGFTIAVGVSVINLFPAFFLFGPYSLNLHHVRAGKRAGAGVAVAIYAVLLLVLNLGVAHYRELSALLARDIGLQVVERLRDNPFGLSDAESWLLFGLGVFFSVVAFIEGRHHDDAYPDFGKRHREMVHAREKYEDEVEEISAELEEVRTKALDDIKRIVHDLKRSPVERGRIRKLLEDLVAAYDRHAEQIDELGQNLVHEYRAANQEARPDGGVPTSHETAWRLSVPEIERAFQSAPTTFPDLASMDQAYEEAVGRINDRYEEVRVQLFEPEKIRGRRNPVVDRGASESRMLTAPGQSDGA